MDIRRSALSGLVIVLLCACGAREPAVPIESAALVRHVETLAADSMLGRMTPGRGLDAAARYIAARFEAIGLPTLPGRTGHRVPYAHRVEHRLRTAAARLEVHGTCPAAGPVTAVSFAPAAGGPAGGPLREAGPVDRAGRTIAADPGSIAIVRDVPAEPYRLDVWIGLLRRRASEADVAGLLLVLDESSSPADLRTAAAHLAAAREPELDLDTPTLPVAVLDATTASRLAGCDQADLHAPLDRRALATADNIIGAIPGSAAPDSLVVFIAHYDHVGTGPPDARGDSIFNGADDNASGTAALIEIARAFSRGLPPRRTVVFAAVAGEEQGMVGSRALFEQDVLDPGRIVAAINLDMIGRNAPDEVWIVGGGRSSLGDLAHRLADHATGLRLRPVPDSDGLLERSDHWTFLARDIPAIGFFSGTHADYHRRSDEADRIDADKAARVATLAARVGRAIADGEPVRMRAAALGRD